MPLNIANLKLKIFKKVEEFESTTQFKVWKSSEIITILIFPTTIILDLMIYNIKNVTGPAITSAEDSKYNVQTISLEEENSTMDINYVSKFNNKALLGSKKAKKSLNLKGKM